MSLAIQKLREVTVRGDYGIFPGDYQALAEAIELVVDWTMVTSCLTQEPVASIAAELSVALATGSITAKAENILSQFWFGALLAEAGLQPKVPPAGGRRPDFVIHADTLDFGVEVKRPASYKSAMPNIEEAARQLRDFGLPGFIVVDLCPALHMRARSILHFADPVVPKTSAAPVFLRASRALSARVRGHRAEGKWSRIVGLFAFARLHAWHRSNPLSPTMTVFMETPIFDQACQGLVSHTADRVRSQFRLALESMTGTPTTDLG